MAPFDWTTASQATVYTAAADRKRLAGKAAQTMVRQFRENNNCLTEKYVIEK